MAKTNVWVEHVECVEHSTMRLQNEDLAQELLSTCNSKMKLHQLAGQNLAKKSNSFITYQLAVLTYQSLSSSITSHLHLQ